VIRNRSDAVVRIYGAIEAFAGTLGAIEIVTRERYALLRSTRIFADLVVMASAVRVAVHLGRTASDPLFFKVVSDRKKVTHVAKLTSAQDVELIKPYLREAYDFSLSS